ncbi:RNA polymerase sigma factor [Novosphingobium resinovorum]|uniref:RNA polymerase sigma factor n=1 Tax=Novosphingobium resinovorum TaxID=158500 RepID=UPI0009DD635E|nr:sigma-70 family RNA polymerase sigma factor [Novosphingobium resinovorum]
MMDIHDQRDWFANVREIRRQIVTWVGSNIVPHEGALRARLRHMAVPDGEIDDIVQDAYVKIACLREVSHIRNGRAYFFATARSVLLDRIRRERIVRIDSLTEADALALADDDPGPERRASARQELERVRQLIAALPERCRAIFELRRIQGISQREIAERLGVPEHTVEAQAVRGLRLIQQAIAKGSDHGTPPVPALEGTREKENHDDQRRN